MHKYSGKGHWIGGQLNGLSRGDTGEVREKTKKRKNGGWMKERMYTSPGHKDWRQLGKDDVKCDKMKGPKGVH